MRLATYLKEETLRLGAVLDSWVIDLQNAGSLVQRMDNEGSNLFSDMLSLLQTMETSFPVAEKIISLTEQELQSDFTKLIQKGSIIPTGEVEFQAPVMRPGKLICVGLNYPQVGQDSMSQTQNYPVLFHKVATSLVGHLGAVIYPRIAKEIIYEGELALVIGRRGKDIKRERALSFVAGYTIANDIGSPDLERRTSQWTSGKMLDTFCPLGPFIVTVDEIPDPNQLSIKTTLNGNIVQDGNTSAMQFDIPFLVSYISSLVTLEPGDIILTGSPKRVGDQPDPQVPMNPGDIVCVEIERIGMLCNPIIAEEN